ncbi:MAG: hypothetical protein WD552_00290 [Candidatus Paceibacterota bacterium]
MKEKTKLLRSLAGIVVSLLVVYVAISAGSFMSADSQQITDNTAPQGIASSDTVLPISWGSLGKQMVAAGVIDERKFRSLYEYRGGLRDQEISMLSGDQHDSVVISQENAGVLLNLFWAFGLSNKNTILTEGPMTSEKYGGEAGRFASTAGWQLAQGNPMDHYAKHSFVSLTPQEQERVKNVTQNIYRPCCGNSTHFPDCNHGMAMLGMLQLLAHEGLSEAEMYEVALQVNSYWFPETYANIAKLFEQSGVSWREVDSKVVLGPRFSSAQGYQQILQALDSSGRASGVSCGV